MLTRGDCVSRKITDVKQGIPAIQCKEEKNKEKKKSELKKTLLIDNFLKTKKRQT